MPKKKQSKKRNKQDATLINITALKKRVSKLERGMQLLLSAHTFIEELKK